MEVAQSLSEVEMCLVECNYKEQSDAYTRGATQKASHVEKQDRERKMHKTNDREQVGMQGVKAASINVKG
jgi:hypothetical protein